MDGTADKGTSLEGKDSTIRRGDIEICQRWGKRIGPIGVVPLSNVSEIAKSNEEKTI